MSDIYHNNIYIGSTADYVDNTWDASSGSFPSGADKGDKYLVTVAGTVDSVSFDVDDVITALVDGASTSTYSANWHTLQGAVGFTDLNDVTITSGSTGDMYYRDSGGDVVNLGVGSTDQFLTGDGITPSWSGVSFFALSDVSTPSGAAGQIYYHTGLGISSIVGTAGQYLTNSAGLPVWSSTLRAEAIDTTGDYAVVDETGSSTYTLNFTSDKSQSVEIDQSITITLSDAIPEGTTAKALIHNTGVSSATVDFTYPGAWVTTGIDQVVLGAGESSVVYFDGHDNGTNTQVHVSNTTPEVAA